MIRPRPEYLPVLDSLRGIAALIVVISHSASLGLLPAILGHGFGGTGVAMFYALSGFLMAHLYLDRPCTWEQVRSFAIARAARVLPLYYLCLLLAIIAFYGWGVVMYRTTNLFDFAMAALLLKARDVLWSVPTEVQFYTIFVLLWWSRTRGLFWVLATLLLAVEACCIFAINDIPTTTILTWGHVFGAGVLISLLRRRYESAPWARRAPQPQTEVSSAMQHSRRRYSAMLADVLAWMTPGLMILSMPQVRRELGFTPHDMPFDSLAFCTTLLILAMAVVRAGPFSYLDQVWLGWLGSLSYGIYLLHMPILRSVIAISESWGIPVPMQFPLALTLTLVMAQISRNYLESPVQRIGQQLRQRNAPTRAATLT